MGARKKTNEQAYREESGFFSSQIDQERIFYRKYWPVENPKRVLVYQHGFGEHSGRYQNLIEALGGTQTAIYGQDLRGHGRSPGIRGHVSDFYWYSRDYGQLVELALKETGLSQAVALGHSMGAVVVLKYILREKKQDIFSGVILSAAAFRPVVDLEKFIKKTFAQILSPFFGDIILDANLDARLLSHDSEVVFRYQSDPLVHGRISLKMGDTFFSSGEELLQRAGEIHTPLLILHGGADAITDPAAAKEFFEKVGSQDKTLKIYPGLYHEIMNERNEDRQRVLSDIREWLLAH
ncbi:MAG: lysophospholipase [Leptospiraceae bacterium]|nr:lysophospholipase [Leptospiraceae bacterium]MDW8305981.1 alpha/beta hydrolase [Leptospiraceae bacterium]